jgi:riboflavin biosynthesis pyrimidine reductase
LIDHTPIYRLRPESAPLDDTALAELYRYPPGATLRMNFVTSADGAVERDGYSAGLSSFADKRVFGVLRMLCDALVVAAGTLRHEGYGALRLDDRQRAWRRAHGLADQPALVVVSGRLDLDPTQAAFTDAPVRPLILTGGRAVAPPGLRDVAEILALPDGTDESGIDLVAGLAELHRRGHRRLLCEGGPYLFGALTAADLVDEVCLTVSPLLAGAGAGRITAGPRALPRDLALRHVLTAGSNLLLRYTRAAAPASAP